MRWIGKLPISTKSDWQIGPQNRGFQILKTALNQLLQIRYPMTRFGFQMDWNMATNV